MKRIIDYLASLVTVMLVIAGIGGLAFEAFRSGGWMERLASRLWYAHLHYPLVAIPATVIALLAWRSWRRHHLTLGHVSRVPVLLVYALMGAGAYFIGQLAVHAVL